ncbi:MAG: nicotinate-nucleotide adenylyltransferase [Methylophilaceae bacterium]
MQAIGILGGTFDPIHNGHLRLAQELAVSLSLSQVRFIPAGIPPHREAPQASNEHRQAMVNLAIADNPLFKLDARELNKTTPCYTVETLAELRAEVGTEQPLCLLMGADAFLGLPKWHQWRELFNLAHIVVAHRPGYSEDTWRSAMDYELLLEWQQRQKAQVDEIQQQPCGVIISHTMTALDISASRIRQMLETNQSPRYLLPEAVLAYIHSHLLYSNLFQEFS